MTDVAPGLLERLQRSGVGPIGRESVSRAVVASLSPEWIVEVTDDIARVHRRDG